MAQITVYAHLGHVIRAEQDSEGKWVGTVNRRRIPISFTTRGELLWHVEVCIERGLDPTRIIRRLV